MFGGLDPNLAHPLWWLGLSPDHHVADSQNCIGRAYCEPMANLDNLSSLRCVQITAAQTVSLRHSVLWPNEAVSHVLLPEDSKGWHYGAFLNSDSDPVAVISFFVEPCPIDNVLDLRGDTQKKAIRFRKFACDPAYQGQGIGTKLLLYAISVAASELAGSIMWCDARKATQGWYERRGLEAFGDVFFKGPVEYIRMKIDLAAANR